MNEYLNNTRDLWRSFDLLIAMKVKNFARGNCNHFCIDGGKLQAVALCVENIIFFAFTIHIEAEGNDL